MSTARFWDSTFVKIVRWLLFVPVGLSALYLIEVVFGSVMEWLLGWEMGVQIVILIFLGGYMIIGSGVFMAIGMSVGASVKIAPDRKVGVSLIGVIYTLAQVPAFYIVISRLDWPFLISKITVFGIAIFFFHKYFFDKM